MEGADLHALDAERGQHVADVVAQRRREDDDQRLRRVDARVIVGEVGDAMQGHGGLARAGGAANDHEAGGRPGDQRELLRIDEPGDVGEMLVGAAPAAFEIGSEAPVAALAV